MDCQKNWRYEIRTEGKLSKSWTTWLEVPAISYDEQAKETVFVSEVTDQSALHGLLNKIRDLGLCLVSLHRRLRRVTAADRQRPAAARIGAILAVPRTMKGHYYLEDDRGVRGEGLGERPSSRDTTEYETAGPSGPAALYGGATRACLAEQTLDDSPARSLG